MREQETRRDSPKPSFLRGAGSTSTLDTKSGVPFYRQIIHMVERDVEAGSLKPGDRLPTIRGLSIALRVNPNTVAKAYMELEIRGMVQTQVGSGTYVTDKSSQPGEKERTRKRVEELCLDLLKKARELGVTRDEVMTVLRDLDVK